MSKWKEDNHYYQVDLLGLESCGKNDFFTEEGEALHQTRPYFLALEKKQIMRHAAAHNVAFFFNTLVFFKNLNTEGLH